MDYFFSIAPKELSGLWSFFVTVLYTFLPFAVFGIKKKFESQNALLSEMIKELQRQNNLIGGIKKDTLLLRKATEEDETETTE